MSATEIFTKVQKVRKLVTTASIVYTKNAGDRNNWVFPGILACGPFPGLDGVNYTNDQEVAKNLENLVKNCEIDTFVSLQNEISLQDGTPGVVEKNFRWAFPNFCNYSFYLRDYKNIEYYHLGINDNTAPSIEKFEYTIASILSILEKGRKIFLHCAGGHGRTGTVVASLLGLIEDLKYQEALNKTQILHDSRIVFDKRTGPKVASPATLDQRNLVVNFLLKYESSLQKSFMVSKQGTKIMAVGGMSTEIHFAKYFAHRTGNLYQGWKNQIVMSDDPNVILTTLNYVVETVKSIEVQGCMKNVLYSPGFLSVGYMIELCNMVYLPSQFLIGVRSIGSLKKILSILFENGVESYAVVGYDGCIPDNLVAWIKFVKLPQIYVNLIENYLESDNVLVSGVYDKSGKTFGENANYIYGEISPSNISHSDIYFLKINESYSSSQNDRDIKIFEKFLPDFDSKKLSSQKSNFVGDWESGLDTFENLCTGTTKFKIRSLLSNDTLPLYRLSYDISKKFMEINNIKITGIVANPYIISNPTYETYYGYLSFTYWQHGTSVYENLLKLVEKDLPTGGTLWFNDQSSTRKDLFEKFNTTKRVHIDNLSNACEELYEWISKHKPKIYPRREYVSIKQLLKLVG